MTPKEDPEAKKARERERRIAQAELTSSSEKLASDQTSDVQAAFGPRFSLFSRMFGRR